MHIRLRLLQQNLQNPGLSQTAHDVLLRPKTPAHHRLHENRQRAVAMQRVQEEIQDFQHDEAPSGVRVRQTRHDTVPRGYVRIQGENER